MQTKNTTQAGREIVKAPGFGTKTVTTFADLAVAFKDSEIEQFAEQVRKGIDHWRTAGKMLVDMTKKHPEAMNRIREKTGLSDSVLQTFARIGRNEIWPPLLVDSSMGARKLLECDYDTQRRYAEQPIEVAIEWKNGAIKTKSVKVSELSRADIAVVFTPEGGIHTLDQQAFRLRSSSATVGGGVRKWLGDSIKPNDTAPAYSAPRQVNVDIGYFSVVQKPDGTVTCEPCGRSAMAQPVRVIPNGQGFKSAIILLYKQEMK